MINQNNMLKTTLLLISGLFTFLRFIKKNIMHWGAGDTFIGYVLTLQNKINFLKLYLKVFPKRYLFITGTNGKTSTTALANHILSCNGYKTLSNKTGSNLERGILSTLVLGYYKMYAEEPDILVFEVDEASLPNILKILPKDYEDLSVVVLNLSRDQLDRYGEVDLLAKSINKQLLSLQEYSLVLGKNSYPNLFEKGVFAKDCDKNVYKTLIRNLQLQDKNLNNNLSYVVKATECLNLDIKPSLVSKFKLVKGRGKIYNFHGTKIKVSLTKNPVSFNSNLKQISAKSTTPIAIYMNDYIPDGRDVSWFYDINYSLLSKTLGNKKVYLLGTRSYDFYNLLSTIGIDSLNLLTLSNFLNYHKKIGTSNIQILSNYSATQDCIKFLSKHNV